MNLLLRARRSPTVRLLTAPARALRNRLQHPGRPHEQRLWERLSQVLADDPAVSVPEFEGVFQLDPRSHLLRRILFDGAYEPALADVCRRFADPERDALDVGANAGFFSVLLARQLRQGRVVALEPTPSMSVRLQSNLVRNGVADRVQVLELAASDRRGEALLTTLPGKEEYASLGRTPHHAMRIDAADRSATLSTFTVPTARLDDLVEENGLRPGFVKIDVEGAEHLVLGGAEALLRVHRPVVLVEINDERLRGNGSSARAVVQMLEAARYRLLDPHHPSLPPATIERLETPHELEEVLAVPTETVAV